MVMESISPWVQSEFAYVNSEILDLHYLVGPLQWPDNDVHKYGDYVEENPDKNGAHRKAIDDATGKS